MPDQEYFRKSAQNQPIQQLGEDIFATSDREDRKLNRFSDQRNIDTLRGGPPAPGSGPSMPGGGGQANPVDEAARRGNLRGFMGDSMEYLTGIVPDARTLMAERYGPDSLNDLDSLHADLQRARVAAGLTGAAGGPGGTVSTIPSDVNPFLSNDQRLAMARRDVGLNAEGTGYSTQVRNDQRLRAEGNAHLASDASPEERRLNRRALLERELRNVNLGGNQSITDLARNRVLHRDLTRQIQQLDKEGQAAQTQGLEERKLSQAAEQKALDRQNELVKSALDQASDKPAAVAEIEWYAKNLFGGDAGKAAEFYKRSRGKNPQEVEDKLYTEAYTATGSSEEAAAAVDAFRRFRNQGGPSGGGQQQNTYKIVGPDGKAVEATVKNGVWADAKTGKPLFSEVKPKAKVPARQEAAQPAAKSEKPSTAEKPAKKNDQPASDAKPDFAERLVRNLVYKGVSPERAEKILAPERRSVAKVKEAIGKGKMGDLNDETIRTALKSTEVSNKDKRDLRRELKRREKEKAA